MGIKNNRIFQKISVFSLIVIFLTGISCTHERKDDDFLLWGLLIYLYLQNIQPRPCISNTSLSPQSDPYFNDQWHLKNTGQFGGTSGEDINVLPVWNSGNRGENIQVVVVDNGIETDHEDLFSNINASFNVFYDSYIGKHGTSVAGLIGADDTNGIGLRGVAPNSCIASYNLLSYFTQINESDAMTRSMQLAHVSNNSWGFKDSEGRYNAAGRTWKDSIEYSLVNGRYGKGIVYSWAAGNGGRLSSGDTTEIDNSNYDGYANYHGVMAVCAVGNDGVRAYYSEKGANLWVCAPSLGNNTVGVSTTDLSGFYGYNYPGAPDYSNLNYTKKFGGTSASTPIVSGVAALILRENPNLSWRDVKIILAKSARKNHDADADWTTNGAGYNINHKYGFGVVDADAAVTLAKTWSNVSAQKITGHYKENKLVSIPDNDVNGVTGSINVSGSGITKIEFVEIILDTDHSFAGQLEVTLTAPSSTQSILAETHPCAGSCGSLFGGWSYGSARHLGEAADGTWTLKVADQYSGNTGTFISWSIKFYGR